MYFNHAFRKTLLGVDSGSGVLNVADGGEATSALAAGEIGIYAKNWGNVALTETPGSAPFYIVQGSYFTSDTVGSHGGYKESVKSKLINPAYITRMFWIQSKAAQNQVVQIPITCGLACESAFRLRLDVKGSPALRLLSHNLSKTVDSNTGCCSTVDSTFVMDPVVTLLNWKDQINTAESLKNMIQARAYKYIVTEAATDVSVAANATQVTILVADTTGVAVGQRTIGTGLPANSFVKTVVANTSIVIVYPTQSAAPTIADTVSVKFYNDLYNEGVSQTVIGNATYLPGTAVATGAEIAASGSNGAVLYADLGADADYDAADNFLELTVAYADTQFGACTFTPSDHYELEPLNIIASAVDDSGDVCAVSCIGGAVGSAGIATEVQAAIQATGSGETVLRDLILSGAYRQEAFPDGNCVTSLRMREIESNPVLATMGTAANRNALYNKFCVLHSVPRFNNPSGTFDNDQYLVEIAVPSAVTLTAFITGTDYSAGDEITDVGGAFLASHILAAAQAAQGTHMAIEMI